MLRLFPIGHVRPSKFTGHLSESNQAGRVGFEPARKRKLKDLQRTGSDLKQRKFMKNHRSGFRGFQRVSATDPLPSGRLYGPH
jgi:hypothetical protein